MCADSLVLPVYRVYNTHMVNKFYSNLLRTLTHSLFYDFAFSPLIFQNNNNSFIHLFARSHIPYTVHLFLQYLPHDVSAFFSSSIWHPMKSLLNHLRKVSIMGKSETACSIKLSSSMSVLYCVVCGNSLYSWCMPTHTHTRAHIPWHW